jgi:hypothetical protein
VAVPKAAAPFRKALNPNRRHVLPEVCTTVYKNGVLLEKTTPKEEKPHSFLIE